MIAPNREREILALIDAWDPASGDLPDEIALAIDESETLRARFDERFARWQPAEEQAVPADLAARVIPQPARRSRGWVPVLLVGLGGTGVVGLAASALIVLSVATMSMAPMGEMAPPTMVMEPAMVPQAVDMPVDSTSTVSAPRQTADLERQLQALGYMADGDGVAANQQGFFGRDANLAIRAGEATISGDTFVDHGVNGWFDAREVPQSTFAIDVDRGSYTFARRRLREGFLPDPSSVRVEEFVNALAYSYPEPDEGAFTVQFEATPSPWNDARYLVRVGLKGREPASRAPVHLTFLVDTSGSMNGADRIELVKQSLKMLSRELDDGDTVAIVTYAGSAGVALSPTPATDHRAVEAALDRLSAGGSTAMGQGIGLAYALAQKTLRQGHVNRVIIASDGDTNVGITDTEELNRMIRGYAEQGIALTTLGFGQGNYQDARMESLANEGDGNYYYIDGVDEARRVFVDELTSTLEVVAKDVKVQVEWNPNAVRRYRQVGYENRKLENHEFRDDAVDAGEIGAGHQVTALYVVELAPGSSDPIATVRVRSKPPGPDAAASERSFSLPRGAMQPSFDASSRDNRMAVAAAAFAERLRGSPYVAGVGYSQILEIARGAARPGSETDSELVELISQAARLSGPDADPRCKRFEIVEGGVKKELFVDDLGHPCD